MAAYCWLSDEMNDQLEKSYFLDTNIGRALEFHINTNDIFANKFLLAKFEFLGGIILENGVYRRRTYNEIMK